MTSTREGGDGAERWPDGREREAESTQQVDVRRGASRFHTELDWLDSWHSFSFGQHYDPANTHHGLFVVNNDDVIHPGGQGFGTHGHQDMEIVTWVLDGALEHRDDTGNREIIKPGLAQRMSAGRGIRHSELNASATAPVHLLQMWVLPDTAGIDPSYEQRDLTDALAGGGLVPLASGAGHDGAVRIHQRDAVCWVARLDEAQTIVVPTAPHVHVFIALGSASFSGDEAERWPDGRERGAESTREVEAIALEAGDAVRLTATGGQDLTAGAGGCEVLIWETA